MRDFRVILIDRKENFEFLPMLPDVIGGWLGHDVLRAGLKKITDSCRYEFLEDEVTRVDFTTGRIYLVNNTLDYEYLIISSGSETNFFKNENIRNSCFKLDNVNDAVKIRGELLKRAEAKTDSGVNIVVTGGGYTGIEIATNANYFLGRGKVKRRIYIVEKADSILTMVPEWMRKEVRTELDSLNVSIICNDSLKEYKGKDVLLESGGKIENALCIWSAGVKTSSFIDTIDAEKERTRIKVREDLRIAKDGVENVFVAGDAGYFFDKRKKSALRMAVMFAIAQGKMAAHNVAQSILKVPPEKYRPLDLGYLIPMANGKAPGVVMGRKIHGRLGYLMHYCMCLYRSEQENKFSIIRKMFQKGKNAKGA